MEEIQGGTAVEPKQGYDASNIRVLEGLEAVRMRPGMYIGSTSQRGLHHCIYEIVDNSIDESLAGYCTEIRVKVNTDHSITVEDNGIGMDSDTLNQVTNLFFTTKRNGTGLGTSLSKEIIELHGGKIKYESTLKIGTKVTISLPLSENL